MEKRKKIGIDLDSTLDNLETVWLEKYNEDYNDNLKEWDNWELYKVIKPECGKKIFDYLREPGFFYNLDIKKDAKEVVAFLAEHYDLYIVTAYIPETCLDKTNWIKKHNLAIDQKNIIFINNKGLLQLDYLIDDGPHNFKDFKGKGVLLDMAYNRMLQESSTLKRVKTWKDILGFFIEEVNIDEYIKEATRKGDNANNFMKKHGKIYSKNN